MINRQAAKTEPRLPKVERQVVPARKLDEILAGDPKTVTDPELQIVIAEVRRLQADYKKNKGIADRFKARSDEVLGFVLGIAKAQEWKAKGAIQIKPTKSYVVDPLKFVSWLTQKLMKEIGSKTKEARERFLAIFSANVSVGTTEARKSFGEEVLAKACGGHWDIVEYGKATLKDK